MTKARNLSGLVFGRLKVLHLEPTRSRRSWACICACGQTKIAAQSELVTGQTRSCGCLKKETTTRKNKEGKTDHSKLSADQKRAYRKWCGMWGRVRHPKGKSLCYADISVHPSWATFSVFLADMGVPPEGYSLDRIKPDEDYGPTNCRWVPLTHQAKNTRRNRRVDIGGKTAIVSDHARDRGLKPDVVFDRLNKLGWDVERSLATPVRTSRKI